MNSIQPLSRYRGMEVAAMSLMWRTSSRQFPIVWESVHQSGHVYVGIGEP